jgi:hypothetical protein
MRFLSSNALGSLTWFTLTACTNGGPNSPTPPIAGVWLTDLDNSRTWCIGFGAGGEVVHDVRFWPTSNLGGLERTTGTYTVRNDSVLMAFAVDTFWLLVATPPEVTVTAFDSTKPQAQASYSIQRLTSDLLVLGQPASSSNGESSTRVREIQFARIGDFPSGLPGCGPHP